MCRLCAFPPTPADYAALSEKAQATLSLLRSLSNIEYAPTNGALQAIVDLDQHRWSSGAEWGRSEYAGVVRRLIFANPDPDRGLKRFVGACLMDMQVPFQRTWSMNLAALDRWFDGVGTIPGHRFTDQVHPHLKKLKGMSSSGAWIVDTVHTASRGGANTGNMYRFMYFLMATFTVPSPSLASDLERLRQGRPGLLGVWKRAWMLLMLLRRDASWVNCLLGRACERADDHKAMIEFHSERFPEVESELPVDSRLEVVGRQFFHWTGGLPAIARQARKWVGRHLPGRPPSVLDALFFGLPEGRRTA